MSPKARRSSPLVSVHELAARLGAGDLVVIDASWYLPAMNRDGKAEYRAGHIPGAVFFDIDEIADHSTGLPHMMPTPQAFAEAVGKLGISEQMQAVVYDGAGLFSAARVWWMLRSFGMADVSILDGGLPAWKIEGFPIESGVAQRRQTSFNVNFDAGAVASLDDVRAALATSAAQVADARPGGRFSGALPEPRPGLPSGHMAGAKSLPVGDIVQNGRLLPPAALREAIGNAGIDPHRPLISSCGSGVSAAIINLAMEVAGLNAPRLYDGSWTEWASRGMPVTKD